jgi:predicted ATP-dependent endonuclease of OLD family
VLIGKNNEGKSNLLNALNVAMEILILHGRLNGAFVRGDGFGLFGPFSELYNWKRDFPIQLQSRKRGSTDSVFYLHFMLEEDEIADFKQTTGCHGNENIPIMITVGKTNEPKIEVPKKGSSSYNKKSAIIAKYISQRISFNYIQAIRTGKMAKARIQDILMEEIRALENHEEYKAAVEKVYELQQTVLDKISEKVVDSLEEFLPQIKKVQISRAHDDYNRRLLGKDIEVIIDDGTPTSIDLKGDGVISLVTLAVLKNRSEKMPASIIAIEEPESHLHSGAIHSIVEVINNIASNNQVIVATHSPLFVQQNNVKANVIVNSGTAKPARTINEIRNVLGVLPSDNLRDASVALVVEGENDKIALSKILPCLSKRVGQALARNELIIKPLHGVSNLTHDLMDLRNSLCRYVVLLDNDEAGRGALNKAKERGLLSETNYKVASSIGSQDSEFEDCLRKEVYESILKERFDIDLNSKFFKSKKKWSERMRDTRTSQGGAWSDDLEKEIKMCVANSLPNRITNINKVIIQEKSGFLVALVGAVERELLGGE